MAKEFSLMMTSLLLKSTRDYKVAYDLQKRNRERMEMRCKNCLGNEKWRFSSSPSGRIGERLVKDLFYGILFIIASWFFFCNTEMLLHLEEDSLLWNLLVQVVRVLLLHHPESLRKWPAPNCSCASPPPTIPHSQNNQYTVSIKSSLISGVGYFIDGYAILCEMIKEYGETAEIF